MLSVEIAHKTKPCYYYFVIVIIILYGSEIKLRYYDY